MKAINSNRYTYLNIGCGSKAHPRWYNADLQPSLPGVVCMDASKPLPFPDASMSVVYSSAMLEHLARSAVPLLLAECRRVLAPDGILRIGVPDFERACRDYLAVLEQACAGAANSEWDHEWMITEILDQSARDVSGGEMAVILAREVVPNFPFILKRIGVDGEAIRESLRRPTVIGAAARLPRRSLRAWLKALMLRMLVGCSEEEVAVGRFRLGGEVHRWAYDRFSMARLVQKAGFDRITIESPFTSRIPEWTSFHLDVAEDGRALKPDLLYMEAKKPAM